VKLNEAIRAGCKLRPKQTYSRLFKDKDGGCVIGAVMIGTGVADFGSNPANTTHISEINYDQLKAKIPILQEITVPICPHPGCKLERIGYNLWNTMVHLNNNHKWTREAIAEWADPRPELHIGLKQLEGAKSEASSLCLQD